MSLSIYWWKMVSIWISILQIVILWKNYLYKPKDTKMATKPYSKTYKTIFLKCWLLKIQSFLPYLTQWKATAKPYGKSTPAGKDAVWQEWPVHSSLSSQTLKHSSSPFLCTQWIALRTQSLQCSCWAHTTTQLNLLLGLKTVFQRTSFNVDSSFRQNICSVIKINPHRKVTIFKRLN